VLGREAQLGPSAANVKGLCALVRETGKATVGQGKVFKNKFGAQLPGCGYKITKAGQLAAADGVNPRR
jgi:hypothetical protein